MQKEAYFTRETIDETGRALLAAVEGVRPGQGEEGFRPEGAALLVLDLQEYFLHPESHAFVPSAPAIVDGLNRLAEAFRVGNRPVIFTRHLNQPGDAGMMASWWRDLINRSNAHSQITTKIDTSTGTILEKSQYDAFWRTPLQQMLQDRGVEQVVISGVMTHLCCETTARAAFIRGFEVFFLVDGNATYNQDLHRASLLTLAHGFAHPVRVAEILARLEPDGT